MSSMIISTTRYTLASSVALIGLIAALPALAAPPTPQDLDQMMTTLDGQKKKLDKQEKLLQEQMQQLDAQKKALTEQQQKLDSLRNEFERAIAQQRATQAAPASAANTTPLGQKLLNSLRGTGEPQAAQNQPVGQAPAAPEHAPEVTVLADRGGVLTPKGALVYEPAIDFAHTSDNEAIISGFTVIPAITVGSINVQKVNQDTFQQVNTFRLGLTNRFEVETRVPFVYGRQETTSRPLNTGAAADTTQSIHGAGLGDVEIAGHYQINNGTGGWPFLIGNLRFKTMTGSDPLSLPVDANGLPTRVATGSGFYNIEPSLTAIYPSDPAVFFANLGYIIGIGRTVTSSLLGGTANVDPGNAVHVSFGLGFGINEASSFSLGYDYAGFAATKINGTTQQGSDLQVGSVLIGYSYRFTDRISANLTTEIGVTSDAPNTRVILRVPIKFQVFGND